MRKIITTGLAATAAALVVAMPMSAQASHAPSKAEQAKIEAAIKAHFKKHYKGVPTGLKVKLSHVDAKYGGFGWSKFIPQAKSNGYDMGEWGSAWGSDDVTGADIPAVGMGYIQKYAGKWRVVGHHFKTKGIKNGCSRVPAAVRTELAKGLGVKACR
ncbi:MAG: hypothetical protein ACKORG_08775 [Actinomycetota bacterium]